MIFNNAPPTTLVATLYYDTEDHQYLQQAMAGSSVTSIKVRAREYMPVNQEREVLGHSSFCYLERKERTGTIRQKYRVKLHKNELTQVLNRSIELPEESGPLRSEIHSRTLHPVVISMYERRVWGHNDDLRITFDERIRYHRAPAIPYDQMPALTPALLGPPAALGPKRILEVKYNAAHDLPSWLTTLLTNIPEALGFSKYLDGMQKLQNKERKRALTMPIL